jgi:hypothetical protein
LEGSARGVGADSGREQGQCAFTAGIAVEICPHGSSVDPQVLQQLDGELEGSRGEQTHLGQRHPLGLPASSVALVLAHHPLQQHGGVGPNEPGEGVEVLAELGIHLVRHRDAADSADPGGFTKLPISGRCSS